MSHIIPSYYRYVSAITIANAGTGYTSVPTITISGGSGSGATAVATILNGQITTVTITNIGTNYIISPTVTLTGGGGSGASLTASLSFASGDGVEYETKGGLLVDQSLPEFIREDYPDFVTFIKKYYEYMDQEGSPLNILLNQHYYDIDNSSDTVLDKLATELAYDFPKVLEVDRKFLYKNIKNIYESKGSKRSILAFFRLLYNEEVEVYYPSANILRASDGQWVEEKSISVISGYNNYEVLNLTGAIADIRYFETVGSITTIKTIPIEILSVQKLAYTNPQSYELSVSIPIGITTIPGPGAGAIATATIIGGQIVSIKPRRIIPTSGVNTGTDTFTYTAHGLLGGDAVKYYNGGGTSATGLTSATTYYVIASGLTANAFKVSATSGGASVNITGTGNNAQYFEIQAVAASPATITNAGGGYLAAPVIEIYDTGGGTGAELRAVVEDGELSSIVVNEAGSGYIANSTSLVFNTNSVRSYITLRDASNNEVSIKAYLQRKLASVVSEEYVDGGNAGFKVGEFYSLNESGDDGRGYATSGYFLETYTFISGDNGAYVRVAAIDGYGVPTSWEVINPGVGFVNQNTTIEITSSTGKNLDITLTTGYLYSYPGKYLNDRGKLSDVNRLQDNNKYQSYSYIIKSTISQSKWIQKYKEILHPAGMGVFSDLIIRSDIDFSANISIEDTGYHFRLFEYELGDSVVVASDSPHIAVSFARSFTETATTSQQFNFAYSKVYSDSVTSQSQAVLETMYAFYDTTGLHDDATINNEKILETSITTSELVELIITSIREVNESITATATGLILIQDYMDPSYLSEDYVGLSYSF